MSPVIDDAPNGINFYVSKELEVVRIEVVVDDKPVCCLLDVLGIHDELLWAYHRTLRIATGKHNCSRAAAWSCESLRASGVIRTESVKFKVLDTESFCEYHERYAVINGVECCAEIQKHKGRHKASISGTHDVIVNDRDRRLSGVVLPVC